MWLLRKSGPESQSNERRQHTPAVRIVAAPGRKVVRKNQAVRWLAQYDGRGSQQPSRIAVAVRATRERDLRPGTIDACLLYTSPSPRDRQKSRMPSSA